MKGTDTDEEDDGIASTALSKALWGLKELVIAAGIGVWLLLWYGVTRTHLAHGDLVDAAFTVLVTTLPVLAFYGHHVFAHVDALPEPPTFTPSPSLS